MAKPDNSVRDKLWNPGHGIRFVRKPVDLNKQLPTDAIPARNGIWDKKNTKDLDQVALHEFTIAELIDLGALAATSEETNVLPNNLEGDIHPAFSINKWEIAVPAQFERDHMFPLGPGSDGVIRPGNYTANNLVVWRALLPSLKLASKFVENAHIFPWYAAILFSPLHEIENTTAQAKKLARPLRKLHLIPQSEFVKPEMAKAIKDRIQRISRDIRLGISDGNAHPMGAKTELQVNYSGVAIPSWEYDNHHHCIYLAYQTIEPLMDDDIGPSTRLALQFHVALILLHEFAHVLLFAKVGSRPFDVYFDNERIAEAGFSFEMNTFGGHPVLLLQYGKTPDYHGPFRAGFLLEDWLGTAKGHQWLEPLSGTDADWNDREWREARSIPISFLEELGQEDFWRCFVSKWGAQALKVYPWTEGRLVQRAGYDLRSQIYSAPKHDDAWLEAARQFSHKSSGPMTPDEKTAIRIANRRISRDKEIKRLVTARRKLQEQEKKGRTKVDETARDITESILLHKIADGMVRGYELAKKQVQENVNDMQETVDDILQDNQTTVMSTQVGELQIWQTRMQEVQAMKDLLIKQIYQCAVDDEHIKNFLKLPDHETPKYLDLYRDIRAANKRSCKEFRNLIQNALDSELLEGYDNLLQNYEIMKEDIGRVSRQSSVDRQEDMEDAIDDQCGALLRRARACRTRKELMNCCEYCEQILDNDYVCQNYRAGACLLRGLSGPDLAWNVWFLSEAIRIYRLMEHSEGENPLGTTFVKRKHAEERFAEAVDELKASKTAGDAKALPAGPNAVEPKIQKIVPRIPSKPKVLKLAKVSRGKEIKNPFTGFGNPPSSPPTPPFDSDPPPKGMSAEDVMSFRLTFKVINQAKRNFLNGDFDLAERGFLELLSLPTTSEWQKARCHAFLANIKTRSDRAERARRALKMYKRFLRLWPGDKRALNAVKQAENLVKRILAEIEQENAATEKADVLGNGHTEGSLDTLFESNNKTDEAIKYVARTMMGTQSAKEEQSGFFTGMLDTAATFLGFKRRREEDDGNNDSGMLGPQKRR